MAESKRFVCELSFALPGNDTLAHTEIVQKITPAIRAVEKAAEEAKIELTMTNKIIASPTKRGPKVTKPVAHVDRGSGANKV